MAVRNRVWDTVQGGMVSWETEFPDGTGAAYPGPGTWGTHTSDYCVTGGTAEVTGPATLLGDIFGPTSLHHLNGSLTEETGTGPTTFATTGVEQYSTGPVIGTQAALFNGSTRFLGDSADPNNSGVRITGNLTIQCILRVPTAPAYNIEVMVTCEGSTAGANTENGLWAHVVFAGGSNWEFAYEWTLNNFEVVSVPVGTYNIVDGEWHHVTWVRDISGGPGNIIGRIYLDGALVAEDTSITNPPYSGPSNARLCIGGNPFAADYAPPNSQLSCIKVVPRVLTQAEVIADYKRWLAEELR